MQQKKQQNRAIYFYALTACLAIGLLLWGLCAPRNTLINTKTNFQNISEDWQLCRDGEWIALDTLRNYAYAQDSVTIQRTLPKTTSTQSLLFYTEYQAVDISIGDANIYNYSAPDGFSFLKTPGNIWHTIPLTPDDAGQTIEITFTCPFSFYRVLPDDIFFLYQGELQIAQAYSIWFCNTVAIFMMILAAISFVNASFWKSTLLKTYTRRLGIAYGFVALWILAEINITTIVLRNSITTYLFSMLLIRLLPLSFYYFLETLSPHRLRWLKYFEWVFVANIFVPFLLQFTLHVSLLQTLPLTYLLALLSIGCALFEMILQSIWHIKTRQKPTLYQILYFSNIVLLLGALGEIYCYRHSPSLGFLRGTSISIAAIVYTIFTRIILVRVETQFEQEAHALTKKNNKLQLLPLMQQINAHFLFNALNSISFLCKRDPKAADEAVLLLSEYMREYMFLVNTGDLIPFSREHALMDAYLQIQQIRFKDKISFSLPSSLPDFCLPPLCIQPFVENAISHGLRHKTGNGTLSIIRTDEPDFIKITVQDDGIGFDVTTLAQSEGLGIQNVQKRLALYGGTATIQSTPQGTTATISIPRTIRPLSE